MIDVNPVNHMTCIPLMHLRSSARYRLNTHRKTNSTLKYIHTTWISSYQMIQASLDTNPAMLISVIINTLQHQQTHIHQHNKKKCVFLTSIFFFWVCVFCFTICCSGFELWFDWLIESMHKSWLVLVENTVQKIEWNSLFFLLKIEKVCTCFSQVPFSCGHYCCLSSLCRKKAPSVYVFICV